MASSAGSSDLNKSSSSKKKKKVTSPTSSPLVTNQKASAAEADVEGGLTMPNQGIGDTDQTAAGQLSAKKAGKRPRKETDARHYKKNKTKLQHYDEMTIEVEKLRAECENSRKSQEWSDQKMKEVVGINKEYKSLVSSLNTTIESRNQHIDLLLARQMDLYEENDQLKKEKEYWKNLYAQRPPVDSISYDEFQNMPGHSQPMPTGDGGSVSHLIPQQQHVNSSFSSQFQNMPRHSQSMPTGGGGSVSQQHVNSSFPGQNMHGHSQPMPTDGGGSVSQQHVNSSFPDQFMNGTSQLMQTGDGESVSPFIGQEKVMEFSYDDPASTFATHANWRRRSLPHFG